MKEKQINLPHNIILGFDGPDNVGKGTQIEKIRKYFSKIPFIVLNIEAPVGNSSIDKIKYGIKNTKNNLQGILILAENNLPQILDRTHFSEYAYSFLRGGHDLKTFLKLEKKCEKIKNIFCIITFIDKPKRIFERDDGQSAFDPSKTEDIEKIIENFKKISKQTIFKSIIINIYNKTEDEVFEEIIEKLEKEF
jgi:thymidylate kinase